MQKSSMTHIPIPDDIAVVVLDMDGTIYRKPRMAWYMICKQWRYLSSLIAERRWRKVQRKALSSQQSAINSQPFSDKWYKDSYLLAMVDIIRQHYRPQEWLQPMLEECKRRRIKIAILSDYEAVEDKLHALGLNPADFDAILATGDFDTIKPDKRLGTILLHHLFPENTETNNAAFNWRHVLFIGDREDTDGQLAHALGAQFIKV